MKGKFSIKITFVVLTVLILIVSLPGSVFAMGEYDGIWVGQETISIPAAGETITETTGTLAYQTDLNTLSLWDPIFGSVILVRSGNQWVLPSPVSVDWGGQTVDITSVVISFSLTNSMSGTISVSVQGYTGTGTLSHSKQSCQTLTNGSTISGISGALDSFQCYQISVPAGATDLDVQTWGGSGDCDLIEMYYKPPFNLYSSENYGNIEQITVPSPSAGVWYIGLTGWENYSGLNLSASFTAIDPPVSNFTADVLEGSVPLKVTFTNQSSGDITAGSWNFGDGTTSIVQNPVHTYSQPGSYTVSLTTTGPGGTDVETKTDFIVVTKVKAMPWLQLLLQDIDE